jgi:guanine nucleotide-binding protein G(i) subunit alpha
MGVCSSRDTGVSRIAEDNERIERELREQQLKESRRVRLLLLGAGESGKSTFLKQLRRLFKENLDSDRPYAATSLHQNVLSCAKALIRAARTFGFDGEFSEADRETIALVDQHSAEERISSVLAARVHKFYYQSPVIHRTLERRDKFWMLDTHAYYFANLMRFSEDGFTPTDEDVLQARIMTNGLITAKFDDQPQSRATFEVVDVGGQRAERKKWIQCFSNVQGVAFFVNLAGFAQVMFEDDTQNRLLEELNLFTQICANRAFDGIPIFLLFNKRDLFDVAADKAAKLRALFDDFPVPQESDAELPEVSTEDALAFLTDKFRATLPAEKLAQVQVQVLSATNLDDVQRVFGQVRQRIAPPPLAAHGRSSASTHAR